MKFALFLLIVNIVLCFLMPLLIIGVFKIIGKSVARPFLIGVSSFVIITLVIGNLLNTYVFSVEIIANFLYYSFFGNVIFSPAFDTLILIGICLLLLFPAACKESVKLTVTYALGFCWGYNIYTSGRYLIELFTDNFLADTSMYTLDSITMVTLFINMLLWTMAIIGVTMTLQAGIVSHRYVIYTAIAFGTLFIYELLYPLFNNWVGAPWGIILILKMLVTIGILFVGYRQLTVERDK